MIIISRTEALKIAEKNPKAKVIKFNSGKYNWRGSQKAYIGKEIQTDANILAIWVERRQDREGPYAQHMCLSLRGN